MELKDFIKETLLSIVKGVEFANGVEHRFYIVGERSQTMADRVGTYVDFDVAIVVNESKEEGKKSGIAVAVANVFGGKSKHSKEIQSNENVNRLKFKIFVSSK